VTNIYTIDDSDFYITPGLVYHR